MTSLYTSAHPTGPQRSVQGAGLLRGRPGETVQDAQTPSGHAPGHLEGVEPPTLPDGVPAAHVRVGRDHKVSSGFLHHSAVSHSSVYQRPCFSSFVLLFIFESNFWYTFLTVLFRPLHFNPRP